MLTRDKNIMWTFFLRHRVHPPSSSRSHCDNHACISGTLCFTTCVKASDHAMDILNIAIINVAIIATKLDVTDDIVMCRLIFLSGFLTFVLFDAAM